jgi:prolyl-tRNA editing enzyme YbaK/EbsC (Cys-tRNA(Pro) deacylase)
MDSPPAEGGTVGVVELHPLVLSALVAVDAPHEVMACDPSLADTAVFCEHYGIDPADSANTIVVVSKKPPGVMAACVALATTRLDVNHTVRDRLSVRKLSFAGADDTVALTGMMIGGVTPFGLPTDLPLLVDAAVMRRNRIVLGGGNRSTKILMAPAALELLPNATVVEGLASPP